MNVVHATGVWAGKGGIELPHKPSSLKRRKVGSSSSHALMRRGLAPSRPITQTFFALILYSHRVDSWNEIKTCKKFVNDS
jgi:hypothetical protein